MIGAGLNLDDPAVDARLRRRVAGARLGAQQRLVQDLTAVAGKAPTPAQLDALSAACSELQRLRVDASATVEAADLGPVVLGAYDAGLQGDTDKYRTGIEFLDSNDCRFWPGEVSVITAHTGIGKSTVATSTAVYMADSAGLGVLYLSLEMGADVIGQRMLAAYTYRNRDRDALTMAELRDPLGHYQYHGHDPNARATGRRKVIEQAARDFGHLPIRVCSQRNLSAEQISTRIVEAAEHFAAAGAGLGLVVVDTLQRCAVGRNDMRAGFVAAVGELERVAAETGCHVLLPAQQNRTSTTNAPAANSIREAGAPGDAASWIVGIGVEVEENPADVILTILKCRGRGRGKSSPHRILGMHQAILPTYDQMGPGDAF